MYGFCKKGNGEDMSSWFTRLFTLPRSANSVSDIEKTLVEKALPGVLHASTGTLLANAGIAAGAALSGLIKVGEADLEKVHTTVSGAIAGSIAHFDPSMASHLNTAVSTTITSLEHMAEDKLPVLVATLISSLAHHWGIG